MFDSRYYSAPVDENHYWAALRYIELNPHRAGFREKAHSLWEFSSRRAHLTGRPDPLVPLNTEAIKRRRWSGKDWQEFLEEADWEHDKRLLKRQIVLTGLRPTKSHENDLEGISGLRRPRRGPRLELTLQLARAARSRTQWRR